ncbi:hypothetical protein LRS13_08190 [Svornostia abyssi]|uniref:Uncharacterized protein n=2 Tax=Svornostia abyssi TaxID=2898438 RepID=A0ABY5PLD0_9ACTN|nr:hypothetical protein LRS13_08190 [Parviterribacteraceae bacterium J379]
MAAAGAPLRTLQGWMGHKDCATTEKYAAFAPDDSQARVLAERAFGAREVVVGKRRPRSGEPDPTLQRVDPFRIVLKGFRRGGPH